MDGAQLWKTLEASDWLMMIDRWLSWIDRWPNSARQCLWNKPLPMISVHCLYICKICSSDAENWDFAYVTVFSDLVGRIKKASPWENKQSRGRSLPESMSKPSCQNVCERFNCFLFQTIQGLVSLCFQSCIWKIKALADCAKLCMLPDKSIAGILWTMKIFILS